MNLSNTWHFILLLTDLNFAKMSYDNYRCPYNDPMTQQNAQQVAGGPGSTTVVTMPPVNGGMVMVQEAPHWSWAATITSIVTMICCSCGATCGFVGLINAIHAYVDHKVGDFKRAAHKRRCAWGFTIAGIVVGVLVWIIFIALIATGAVFAKNVAEQHEQSSMNSGNSHYP